MLEANEIDLTSIEEFLSDDVFWMIEGMYWKIANRSTKDRVTEVILMEMNRAKEKLTAEISKMPVQRPKKSPSGLLFKTLFGRLLLRHGPCVFYQTDPALSV